MNYNYNINMQSNTKPVPPKRPPADRGQGRKSVAGSGKSPVIQLVVSAELKEKFMRNGAVWAREALTKAKDPKVKK